MTYKNKSIALSSVIAALAVVYILTLIFDPQRRDSRSSVYSWLEPGQNNRISGITITRNGETISLSHNNGKWFVARDGKDYPARKVRVDDFIAALAKKDSYPVRSSSDSSHDRLSLTPDKATQVIVFAGPGLPLLNLLIGQPDITGQYVYLRKQGENEVRSGEDRFSTYTESVLGSWYNLRLFPENEEGRLSDSDVQRLIVYPNENESPMIFTRSNREWTFSFKISNPDFSKVDSYIRDILGVAGEDFIDGINPSDSLFDSARIVLEFGSGASKTLRFAPADENDKRYAVVTGSDYVYSIPGWMVRRLFPGPENFESGIGSGE